MEMAIRTSRRMMEGRPVVNTFLFDDSILYDNSHELSIKVFNGYSEEWARFIFQNRNNLSTNPIHSYDIIIGPIANDTVGLQMHRFALGYISIERMIEELRFHTPAIQYFFGTPQAIRHLKKYDE